MQARLSGRADVHPRPPANGLEPLEDLDFVGGIIAVVRFAAGLAVARLARRGDAGGNVLASARSDTTPIVALLYVAGLGRNRLLIRIRTTMSHYTRIGMMT